MCNDAPSKNTSFSAEAGCRYITCNDADAVSPSKKKYFFKNRKQFAGTSRSSVRTIERCQVLPRDRYLTVMHVRIPLGGNIRTEPSFTESATLPKIHHIKSRGFSQRGFFLLRLLSNYQNPIDSIAILIRYEHFSAARFRPTSCSEGEADFSSVGRSQHTWKPLLIVSAE